MYIAFILDAYEKEVAKKARKKGGGNPARLKDFRYPPVLPIVFYDGDGEWTAELNFLHRTELHEAFEKYIPKFEYELVNLGEYGMDDLVKFGDMLSLFMMLNKLKNQDELRDMLASMPDDYIEKISGNVPENLKKLLADVTSVLLAKIDLPQDEIDEVASRIHEKGVPEMFRNFNREGYSVTQTRLTARAEEREIWQASNAEKDAIIAEKDAELSEKDAELSELAAIISEQGTALSEKDAIIAELQAKLAKGV